MPTRSWVVLLAVLAAMWYAAVSQRNSAAYLLMFFLSGLVLVSSLHAHFALADLRLHVGRIEPVFEGETARTSVEVTNLSRRGRVALVVAPNRHVFKEGAHTHVPPLGAKGSQFVEMTFPARARGRQRLDRLALTTTYPLGFWRSWRYETTDASFLVYPRAEGNLPLPAGPALTADVPTGQGAGGDDYSGVRPYQLGREPAAHRLAGRRARGQPLLVKKFSGRGQPPGLVRVRDHRWPRRRRGAPCGNSAAGSWTPTATASRTACACPAFEAEPASGSTHFHRCLGALALYDPHARDEVPVPA